MKTLTLDLTAWKAVYVAMGEGLERLRIFGKIHGPEYTKGVEVQGMIKRFFEKEPVSPIPSPGRGAYTPPTPVRPPIVEKPAAKQEQGFVKVVGESVVETVRRLRGRFDGV